MLTGAISAQSSLCHTPSLVHSLLTICHHMSQCVTDQGPVQTDLGLTSLNLFAWPPRLWLRLRFAPCSKPRTEDGGRRQKVEDRSHLIEQLVALHTTYQLCPDKRIFFVLPNIFNLYFLYELFFIYCFNFRHKCICIWLIKLWYSQERSRTFYAPTKLGQSNFEQMFSFFFFLIHTGNRYKLLEYVLRILGKRSHTTNIEYGCENVWRKRIYICHPNNSQHE